MLLTQTIQQEMTAAMRAGDAGRRDALRLLIAAFQNARIAAGHELDDDEAIRVLQREAKQRREWDENCRRDGIDPSVSFACFSKDNQHV